MLGEALFSLQGDVYFYYGLVNFYQNHRRYVRSRDDSQLLGKTNRVSADCQPFQFASNGSDLDLTPCGAIANSRFNGSILSPSLSCSFPVVFFRSDTLRLTFNGSESVPLTNIGIAWSTDKAVKFHNPPSPETCKFVLPLLTDVGLAGEQISLSILVLRIGIPRRGISILRLRVTTGTRTKISSFGCEQQRCRPFANSTANSSPTDRRPSATVSRQESISWTSTTVRRNERERKSFHGRRECSLQIIRWRVSRGENCWSSALLRGWEERILFSVGLTSSLEFSLCWSSFSSSFWIERGKWKRPAAGEKDKEQSPLFTFLISFSSFFRCTSH